MPYRDLEKRRACRRRWYKNHKSSEKKYVFKRKQEIKKWFENYKASLFCSKCGEKHPAIIDFHHLNGKEKENGISFMVANGYSVEKIMKEMSKCGVLCANCHRKEHYNNSKL